jgi:pimeloyl-ACP methyl ester carboxylesterase
MEATPSMYRPRRAARSEWVTLRGVRHHVRVWGALSGPRSAPSLVLLHGYMDTGASFQFLVDALAELEGEARLVVAPDLRGFGLTETPPTDAYFFPDYLGDLDGLLTALFPGEPVDLLGHSMGGNVVMIYAGVRPGRVRRLINLEGFGLPEARPEDAPARYAQWLEELARPERLRDFESFEAVAAHLRKNDPRLAEDKAQWLARTWATPHDGRFRLLADPGHKRVNPVLYRKAEALACWARISAPLLVVQGGATNVDRWWGDRYSLAEFGERLQVVAQVERQTVADAAHMLHHDQPEALAAALLPFLQRA